MTSKGIIFIRLIYCTGQLASDNLTAHLLQLTDKDIRKLLHKSQFPFKTAQIINHTY